MTIACWADADGVTVAEIFSDAINIGGYARTIVLDIPQNVAGDTSDHEGAAGGRPGR